MQRKRGVIGYIFAGYNSALGLPSIAYIGHQPSPKGEYSLYMVEWPTGEAPDIDRGDDKSRDKGHSFIALGLPGRAITAITVGARGPQCRPSSRDKEL